MSFLPDFEELMARQQEIYDTYRKSGMPPAFKLFAELIKLPAHEASGITQAFDARNGPYKFSNGQYWFEREAMAYPPNRFDLEVLQQHKKKLLLANSDLADRTALQYRANVELGKQLELDVEHFPGAHLGYFTHAQQFADKLLELLKAKDQYYAQL